MVSLRGPTWVAAAGFVLVAVGLGFLVTGAPIVGIGFCALAVGLVGTAARGDDATDAPDATADVTTAADSDADSALSTLRDRYARGELSDAQFEAKLERLLEVETLEDVEVSVEGRSEAGFDGETDANRVADAARVAERDGE